MNDHNKANSFQDIALPHLDAAYNLARWLTRNNHEAEDLVQIAFERALKFFDGFRGGDARAWLLTIVRNTYFTSIRDRRKESGDVCFDEEIHHQESSSPETILAADDTKRIVNQALERLPSAFKEVVVLKEMEDLSYKEIAEIVGVPIGTVMSRLARGRKLLVEYLEPHAIGGSNEL